MAGIEYRNITEIKPNPTNPRIIKDDRFKKLVQSITDFPEMLEKRPLVCFTDTDSKLVVLGGNMRLKAAKECKLKKLPVMLADDWNEEQKKQFLIKDNVGFGEWDWDQLANEWDSELLTEWGLDVPGFGTAEEKDAFADEGIDGKNQYGVIVMCANEAEQEHIFTRLTGEGFNCKIVVT